MGLFGASLTVAERGTNGRILMIKVTGDDVAVLASGFIDATGLAFGEHGCFISPNGVGTRFGVSAYAVLEPP